MKLNFSLTVLLVVTAVVCAFSQVGYIVLDTTYSQGYGQEQAIFKNNREVKLSRSKRFDEAPSLMILFT